MPKLTGKYVGGLTAREAAADAKAVKAEIAGRDSKRFKSVVVPLPANSAEVKAARKVLHVSQIRFAELVGVSLPSVKAWERGARRPDGVTSRVIRLLRRDPHFMQTWQSV